MLGRGVDVWVSLEGSKVPGQGVDVWVSLEGSKVPGQGVDVWVSLEGSKVPGQGVDVWVSLEGSKVPGRVAGPAHTHPDHKLHQAFYEQTDATSSKCPHEMNTKKIQHWKDLNNSLLQINKKRSHRTGTLIRPSSCYGREDAV